VSEFNADVSIPGDNITYIVTPYIWTEDGTIYNGSSSNHSFIMENNIPNEPLVVVSNYTDPSEDLIGYCVPSDDDVIQGQTVLYEIYENDVLIDEGNNSIIEYSFQPNSTFLPGITEDKEIIQFEIDNNKYLIQYDKNLINGYIWDGTEYIENSSIASGLSIGTSYYYTLDTSIIDGELHLFRGVRSNKFYLYDMIWNGSSWVNFENDNGNEITISALNNKYYSVTSFNFNDNNYLLIGITDGRIYGYEKFGIEYIKDEDITNGMNLDYGSSTDVETYEYRGALYAIATGGSIPKYFKWNGVDAWEDGTWNDATNDYFFKSAPTTSGIRYPKILEHPENGMIGMTFASDISANTQSRNAFPYDMGYMNGEEVPITLPSENISYGSEFVISCSTDDGYSQTSYVNSSTIEVNTNPNAPTLTLEKEYVDHIEPDENVSFVCDVNEDDVGNNNTVFYYMSDNNDTTIMGNITDVSYNGQINITLDANNITDGDTWYFVCYTNDGVEDSPYTEIIGVTTYFSAVAPTISSVSIFPEILTERSDIIGQCLIEDANDLQDINYSYKFYKNGELETEIFNVESTEGVLLEVQYDTTPVLGDAWVFSCMGTDGEFDTEWQNSTQSVVTSNTQPQNPNAYIQSPLEDTTDLVALCNSYDANNDSLSMNYKTYKNGVVFSSGVTSNFISGVNKSVTTILSTDLVFGDNWTISCQANDALVMSEYTNSTETIVIKNPVAPTSNYNQIRPTIMLQNETVSITSLASDINLDNVNFEFTLYVDDVNVETKTSNDIEQGVQTSAEFDYSSLAIGEEVVIGVVLSDVDFTNTEVNTSTLIVRAINNVPNATNIRLDPNAFIGQDDDIVGYCTATDSDNDTLNYNYSWYVNDVSVKTGTKVFSNYLGYEQGVEIMIDTISSSNYSEGDIVIFSCSAYDAKNQSDFINSTEQYIFGDNNFAPNMIEATIIPSGTHTTLIDFTIHANSTDGDNNETQYDWRFVKNGAYQNVETTGWFNSNEEVQVGALSNISTQSGDTYYVRIRAYDGEDYSEWSVSNVVIVDNTAPTMITSEILNSPLENTTIESSCVANDIDSEQTITFTKEWYKDGVKSYEGDSLSSTLTQEGEEWILGCTAFDGFVNSSQMNSSSFNIIGTSTIPTLDYVTLNGDTSELTGACKSSDVEGDNINYTFVWYENGNVTNTTYAINEEQGIEQSVILVPTINAGDEFIFSCESTDIDGSTSFVNSTTLIIPVLEFSHAVSSTTATTIEVQWTTNADQVQVYLNDELEATTSLIKWTFEGLVPDTEYEITLVPVKDSFVFEETTENATTEETDNHNPIMTNVTFSPISVYTEDAITGTCVGTDIDELNLFYTYTWRVNNVSIDSGVTQYFERDENVVVGSLTSSNYIFNDTISLECSAFDGIGNSNIIKTEIVVQNTMPIIDDELIAIQIIDGVYKCDHTYSDADNDEEINQTYRWFINDVIENSSITNELGISYAVVDDEVVCELTTGDLYYNITKNSSVFTVGDFEKPVITNLILPSSVYTDTSVYISTICSDNLGVANHFPKIRYINPNYVEEEFELFYDGGDKYAKYQTFNIAGTYTNIEIECKDGNANSAILQYEDVIVSLNRETVVNVGGGGSGSTELPEEQEEFRNITSFEVTPTSTMVKLSPGSETRAEFEVINKDIVDIDFTVAILVGTNEEAYTWMSFSGDTKAISMGIDHESGLSSNSKFVRYNIAVPEDVVPGIYKGIIEINGMGQTEKYYVDIEVKEGQFVSLFSFLQYELFDIPFTKEQVITGAVTGVAESTNGTPVTVGGAIISFSILGTLGFVYRRLRLKV